MKDYRNIAIELGQTLISKAPETREDVERMLPELKESEDERIKHEIKVILANTDLSQFALDYTFADMLAWLEKQKTSEEALQYLKENHSPSEMSDFQAAMNVAVAKAYDKGYNDGLEKQGNPTDINPSEFDLRFNKLLKQFGTLPKEELANSLSFYLNVVQNDGTYKPDEKQGEQKPVVIIPKFRIGDSIKTTNEEPLTITEITDSGYWSEDLFVCNFDDADKWELVEQKPTNKVEPKFHEGDWVVSNRYTSKPFCITKVCDTYYLVDSDSFIPFEQESDWRLWNIQDAKTGDVLACNEEILLFKSYSVQNRISLYCWYNGQTNNFHNKEVNDMSVTTRNKICPATKEQRDTLEKVMADAGYTFDFEKKELKKIEQKPAWSEEDEKNLLEISCLIGNYRAGDDEYKLDSWLKFLRKRVLPQPKQEWSEEDETHRHWILEMLKAGEIKTPEFADHFIAAFNWLKSLRPQNTWKPSDEQMEVLLSEVKAWTKGCPKQIVLESLYNDLKKLKGE